MYGFEGLWFNVKDGYLGRLSTHAVAATASVVQEH